MHLRRKGCQVNAFTAQGILGQLAKMDWNTNVDPHTNDVMVCTAVLATKNSTVTQQHKGELIYTCKFAISKKGGRGVEFTITNVANEQMSDTFVVYVPDEAKYEHVTMYPREVFITMPDFVANSDADCIIEDDGVQEGFSLSFENSQFESNGTKNSLPSTNVVDQPTVRTFMLYVFAADDKTYIVVDDHQQVRTRRSMANIVHTCVLRIPEPTEGANVKQTHTVCVGGHTTKTKTMDVQEPFCRNFELDTGRQFSDDTIIERIALATETWIPITHECNGNESKAFLNVDIYADTLIPRHADSPAAVVSGTLHRFSNGVAFTSGLFEKSLANQCQEYINKFEVNDVVVYLNAGQFDNRDNKFRVTTVNANQSYDLQAIMTADERDAFTNGEETFKSVPHKLLLLFDRCAIARQSIPHHIGAVQSVYLFAIPNTAHVSDLGTCRDFKMRIPCIYDVTECYKVEEQQNVRVFDLKTFDYQLPWTEQRYSLATITLINSVVCMQIVVDQKSYTVVRHTTANSHKFKKIECDAAWRSDFYDEEYLIFHDSDPEARHAFHKYVYKRGWLVVFQHHWPVCWPCLCCVQNIDRHRHRKRIELDAKHTGLCK